MANKVFDVKPPRSYSAISSTQKPPSPTIKVTTALQESAGFSLVVPTPAPEKAAISPERTEVSHIPSLVDQISETGILGNSNKPSLDTLFSKEMSRKEFLLTIGVGLTSLLGLSSILTLLSDKPKQQLQLSQNSYSSGPYGGYKQA